jgi:hypothetical protein
MGVCVSSQVEASEEEKALHREAEKSLKEVRLIRSHLTSCVRPALISIIQAKAKLNTQAKVGGELTTKCVPC